MTPEATLVISVFVVVLFGLWLAAVARLWRA